MRWFSFWISVWGGAEEVTQRRDIAGGNLSYFLEFRNENCRKWSLGIYAGTVYVYFEFCHQGAELFSAEGRKMGVLNVFKGFDCTKGPKRVPKAPRGC